MLKISRSIQIVKSGSEKVSIDWCKLTRCAAEQKNLGQGAAKLPKCVIC